MSHFRLSEIYEKRDGAAELTIPQFFFFASIKECTKI